MFVLILSAMAACLNLTACNDDETSGRVIVRCLDGDGKPVAGAEVHVFQNSGDDDARYVHSGPYESGEDGRALCDNAVFRTKEGNFDRWFYVRVPGRLVGVVRSTQWTNQQPVNADNTVLLQPSQSMTGRVTVPPGYDATQVTVHVQVLHVSTGTEMFEYQSFPRHSSFPGLDTALTKIFDRQPDAQGNIRFDDVPVSGRLIIVTQAKGLGQAQWSNNPDRTFSEPIALTLEPESFVAGSVLRPDGSLAVGMQIKARLQSRGRLELSFLTTFETITDRNGDFLIEGLPQTELTLSVEDPDQTLTFLPRQGVIFEPDSEPLTLMMESAIKVSGRVFDPDENPVAGAAISAIAESGERPGLDNDQTDADGRFELRLPSGRALLYFNSLPSGFQNPKPQVIRELDLQPGQPGVSDLTFTLDKADP